jgi:plastocyanin
LSAGDARVAPDVRRACRSYAWRDGQPAAVSPTATIHLRRGGRLTITDNDVMPHTLIATRARGAQVVTPAMTHMGARSTVSFPTPGTYVFTTRAGEDYMTGVQTIGPDHDLVLNVDVS